MLPWSLCVIKAKHKVNLISIFNIDRLKKTDKFYTASAYFCSWHGAPESDQDAVYSLYFGKYFVSSV